MTGTANGMLIWLCVRLGGGKKIKRSTVIISIGIIAAVEISVQLLISRNLTTTLIGLGWARFIEIILLLTLIKVREKQLAIIGLTTSGIYRGLKRGLVWAVLFGAAAGGVLFIIYFGGVNVPVLFQMQLPSASRNLIAFFLVGTLFGPIAEEIFFRGILYGFLRRFGIPAAIMLSTLFFVLPHTSGLSIPTTQLIGGILFAVSYEVEKNLMVPITIHLLGNLAIFTMSFIIN